MPPRGRQLLRHQHILDTCHPSVTSTIGLPHACAGVAAGLRPPSRIRSMTPILPPGPPIPQAIVESYKAFHGENCVLRMSNPNLPLPHQVEPRIDSSDITAIDAIGELVNLMVNLRLDDTSEHEAVVDDGPSQVVNGTERKMSFDLRYISAQEDIQRCSPSETQGHYRTLDVPVAGPKQLQQQMATIPSFDEQAQAPHFAIASKVRAEELESGPGAESYGPVIEEPMHTINSSTTMKKGPVEIIAFRITKMRETLSSRASDVEQPPIADQSAIRQKQNPVRGAKRKLVAELRSCLPRKRSRRKLKISTWQSHCLGQREAALKVGQDRQERIREIRRQRYLKLRDSPKWLAWGVECNSPLRKKLRIVEWKDETTGQLEMILEEEEEKDALSAMRLGFPVISDFTVDGEWRKWEDATLNASFEGDKTVACLDWK